ARRDQPWLYSVLTALRQLALYSPDEFTLPRHDITAEIRRQQLDAADPDHILRTAEHANFLCADGDLIRPRIPLLARLAAVVNPSPGRAT
ncbi:MAG TPA: hypothetical protein VD866_08990, partial [Urbifossiella sp.]|nr:hypothetical protein [Urbifossiella sp.]